MTDETMTDNPLKTFGRDKIHLGEPTLVGLRALVETAECMQTLEEYGLSVVAVMDGGSLKWRCTDVEDRITVEAGSARDAIFWWNVERQRLFESNDDEADGE